jgi:hypothetical protein
MIWTTWRQHRAEAAVGALILAALAAAMVIVGSTARDRARALGLPACQAMRACPGALSALHNDFRLIPSVTAALIAVPLLAGMFWAAPLVSREYEAGTHRLAWTQSVSPLRWITIKIVLIFGVLATAALALGLLATWTLDPLTAAFGGRYNSTWYAIQGIVPVACILFALAVGVAASALIRRTIPAMAVTLVAYAATRIPIEFIRARFAPITTRAYTIPLSALLRNPGGAPQYTDVQSNLSPSDWVQSITITDPSGHLVQPGAGNLNVLGRYCPDLKPPGGTPAGAVGGNPAQSSGPPPSAAQLSACKPAIHNLSLHEKLAYQPASHFWLIQTVESAIFLTIAALLVTAAVYAVTRRRPT